MLLAAERADYTGRSDEMFSCDSWLNSALRSVSEPSPCPRARSYSCVGIDSRFLSRRGCTCGEIHLACNSTATYKQIDKSVFGGRDD